MGRNVRDYLSFGNGLRGEKKKKEDVKLETCEFGRKGNICQSCAGLKERGRELVVRVW